MRPKPPKKSIGKASAMCSVLVRYVRCLFCYRSISLFRPCVQVVDVEKKMADACTG